MQEGLLPLTGNIKDGTALSVDLLRALKIPLFYYPDFTGPCIWLDTLDRHCMHYEHRPSDCRNFELGGQACLEARASVTEADYEAACGLKRS